MSRPNKDIVILQHNIVLSAVSCMREWANSDADIQRLYDNFLKTGSGYATGWTRKMKKDFKEILFKEIPYTETKNKMEKLFRHRLTEVSFEGREIKNIQKFLRETKLKNL